MLYVLMKSSCTRPVVGIHCQPNRHCTAQDHKNGGDMRADTVLITVLLLIRAVDPAASQVPVDPARQVFAAESTFAASMAARDFGAFALHVSEEAVFFGTTTIQRGKAEVLAAWRRFFTAQDAPFSWRPETVEVLDSGTLALSTGPVRDANGRSLGTFTSIWRLESDGRWRIIFDKGSPPCECGRPPETTLRGSP